MLKVRGALGSNPSKNSQDCWLVRRSCYAFILIGLMWYTMGMLVLPDVGGEKWWVFCLIGLGIIGTAVLVWTTARNSEHK